MTKQVERYFYFDEEASTVWWTADEEAEMPQFIFLGSSMNPNLRMTVSVMVKQLDKEYGYKIKELP
jgi:hypothetical protein